MKVVRQTLFITSLCCFALPSSYVPASQKQNGANNDLAPLPDGALVRFSAPKGETIKPIGFIPGGKTLVLWTKSAILLGDVETGKTKPFLRYEAKNRALSKVRNAALSPDGKTLLTNGYEITKGDVSDVFTLWDISSGARIHSFKHPFGEPHNLLEFSFDGKHIAWDHKFPAAFIYTRSKNPQIQKIEATRPITDICFSPSGQLLAIAFGIVGGHKDYQIQVWKLATMERIALLTEKKRSGGTSIAFSPDSRFLAVGDGEIDLWDLKTKKIHRRLSQPGADICWLPCGDAFVLSNRRNNKLIVRMIEVVTGDEICAFQGHNGQSLRTVIDAQAQVLASADRHEVLVWDLQAPSRLKVEKNARLSAKSLVKLWQDLDARQPSKGYRAMLQLAQGGKQVVGFLERRLTPDPTPDLKEIKRLIKDLDAQVFAEREKAMTRLKQLGRMAKPEMERALAANPPLEVQMRLNQLLDHLRAKEFVPGDLQKYRAVHVLERIGSDEATAQLRKLAGGGEWSLQTDAAQAALARVKKRQEKTSSP